MAMFVDLILKRPKSPKGAVYVYAEEGSLKTTQGCSAFYLLNWDRNRIVLHICCPNTDVFPERGDLTDKLIVVVFGDCSAESHAFFPRYIPIKLNLKVIQNVLLIFSFLCSTIQKLRNCGFEMGLFCSFLNTVISWQISKSFCFMHKKQSRKKKARRRSVSRFRCCVWYWLIPWQ